MTEYKVTEAATGTVVAEYPTATDAQIEAALEAANSAYYGWSRKTSVAERAALIAKVAQLHEERREELAKIIVREMGKPLEQALGEVDFCVEIYNYFADIAEKQLQDEELPLNSSGRAFLRYQPIGALLGIMPWNFPYYQVARFAGPNLVLGNTIVLKHAPQCPESAEAIQKIFTDAGFPEGAYVNVYATHEQIEKAIGDPRIQGVSLTGSDRAGAAVAEIAGRNLKKVVLELGGSDPFILLSTDDLDATVEAAIGARLDNSGQACNAAKRFIVDEKYYDEFVEKFTSAISAIEVGDPAEEGTVLGPLSSQAAADRLEEQVERAIAHGAEVKVRGERNGTWFPSAVLTNVTPDNPAHHEEFFGPVASIYKVRGEDEAVELANDTPFGLGSYVFTTDEDQQLRIADAIEAGMVFINGVGLEAAEIPFGGIKRSGYGRELGPHAFEEFANKKMIRING
ncbi:NAD-dependent succinate-semialdehyde dehydrogenase [Sediminivirga luteola]|uniref:NAD-dependent succinate-semialdehyde dehydrogenase n=1 Tax=Sediminivirga luteola TaxID=1774748 RepID=UPI001F595E90|nr:NAD-dependent succinate-semialdehyde dehydrogenase [Sediminivirga luteola]MCI2265093.1 NAD-dependent succinate-semialdehyde dehydrogenase [Sediminivirga luteola]